MATTFNEEAVVRQLREEATRSGAFSQLVKAYSSTLYWHIRRMVLTHEDTDDLLQNTFVKAWTHIDSFQGNSRILTWLYRIATNEALTFLAKQSAEALSPIDETDGAKLEADAYFDGDELQLLLQKAILTLPPKQRLVFNMRYFEEMKYEDISQIVGTSVGALKASYHLAVSKVTAYLEKENIE